MEEPERDERLIDRGRPVGDSQEGKRRTRFTVVCLYGHDLNSPLGSYLSKVADDCIMRSPQTVIVCGGETQPVKYPGLSEARVASSYLSSRFTAFMGNRIYEEPYSFTTHENIRNAAARMKRVSHRELERCDITIWCEATRALKVAALARAYMGFPPAHDCPPIRIKTDSWEQMHPVKELVGTIKDYMCIYVPGFGDLHSWHRRRKARTQ